MKTAFTVDDVKSFLENIDNANPTSLRKLAEGHISQAFCFDDNNGAKFVLRIANKRTDFDADKFAADTFGQTLHVPSVIKIGKFNSGSYYCISTFAQGTTSNLLNQTKLKRVLPSIQNSLANMFHYDISPTTGYGPVDVTTGNARYTTCKDAVRHGIEAIGVESFRTNATNIGLDASLADAFFAQFKNNLQYASETRRLIHGDPAFDNMLVKDGNVTAVIDWAQMGYGDWMSDFARLDFWWQGRYGDARAFASHYDLETKHLDERRALYWATNALMAIEFADRAKSESVAEWLKEHVGEKLA